MAEPKSGVVLRVFGRRFKAREFLRRKRVGAYHVWEKGELAPVKGAPPFQHGGFMVIVSDAEDVLEQRLDLYDFLRRNRALLRAVRDCPRVSDIVVEITFRAYPSSAMANDYIPPKLIRQMAGYGMALLVSVLPAKVSTGRTARRRPKLS